MYILMSQRLFPTEHKLLLRTIFKQDISALIDKYRPILVLHNSYQVFGYVIHGHVFSTFSSNLIALKTVSLNTGQIISII